MAQLMLNNQDYANDFRDKINANFTELYGNNVPTNHATNDGTYGLGTNALYGHVRVTNGNGLNLNNGTISFSQASTVAYGAVRLASSASSTSTTDVVTSAILNGATRGMTTLPRIWYGTTDPSTTNPGSASQDGDLYVKYA